MFLRLILRHKRLRLQFFFFQYCEISNISDQNIACNDIEFKFILEIKLYYSRKTRIYYKKFPSLLYLTWSLSFYLLGLTYLRFLVSLQLEKYLYNFPENRLNFKDLFNKIKEICEVFIISRKVKSPTNVSGFRSAGPAPDCCITRRTNSSPASHQ